MSNIPLLRGSETNSVFEFVIAVATERFNRFNEIFTHVSDQHLRRNRFNRFKMAAIQSTETTITIERLINFEIQTQQSKASKTLHGVDSLNYFVYL